MHLSSIFKEYGIDIDSTKLVRHPLNKEDIAEIYEKNLLEDYQASQSKNCFDNCKYIASFVGTNGTEALFFGLYEIKGSISGPCVKQKMPSDYPYPDHFDENHIYYEMEKLDILKDLEKKLVIQWGKSTLSWFQWANNDKEIISIMDRSIIEFPGYDELIVPYSDLGEILNEVNSEYSKWRDALKNVNGIYLICDTKHNKQYIGSTYNGEGILGRWSNYYRTKHGGDEGLKDHLKKHPDAYLDFQFSILKILPNLISPAEAIKIENLYKNKLCTEIKNMD